MDAYYNQQATGSRDYDTEKYTNYYEKQSGDGFSSYYVGSPYQGQRGGGWFGRVIKGGLMPLLSKVLPYIGGKAVEAYSGMASDFRQGKDLKEIGKRQLRRSGASFARDIADKLSPQDGSGIRKRKRRSKTTKNPIVRVKRRRKSSSKGSVKKSRRKKKRTKSSIVKDIQSQLFT